MPRVAKFNFKHQTKERKIVSYIKGDIIPSDYEDDSWVIHHTVEIPYEETKSSFNEEVGDQSTHTEEETETLYPQAEDGFQSSLDSETILDVPIVTYSLEEVVTNQPHTKTRPVLRPNPKRG